MQQVVRTSSRVEIWKSPYITAVWRVKFATGFNMRDAVNAVVEVDHSSTLHVQSVTQNALLTGEEVKHASHTLVVKSMAQHESRLPRVRSTLTLRTAASISSLRTTSRLHAPTPSKAAAPVASARAGPSLTRKPSTRLDTSAKRTATTSTTMTGSVRPAPAPASRPAAPVARPAATRPLPPDPPAKAPRPAHARSMVQPPKVHVRTSPKSHAVMPPLARRVVSKPDLLQPTQRILSSSNMAPPKPVRRVLSTAEALPLSPKKTIKPTPVTPARKVPLVADTPLLPRLVSRPFPASTMQMIKDEERPFGDEPIVSDPTPVLTDVRASHRSKSQRNRPQPRTQSKSPC